MFDSYERYFNDLYMSFQSLPIYGQVLVICFSVFSIILSFVCYWILFTKAGEKGWKCLIPIYNAYVGFKIWLGIGWIFLLMLIPFVNVVVFVVLELKIALAYNKSSLFGVGLIFLPLIFYSILAFGKSKYIGYC